MGGGEAFVDGVRSWFHRSSASVISHFSSTINA